MERKYLGWRILLWGVALYHLGIGALMLCSGELTIRAARVFAGATVTGSPELGGIGEIFACYLLVFGVMMAVAAWNPVKNRSLISIAMVLFVLRLLQRLVFADKAMAVFQIPAPRYWMTVGVVFLLSLGMGIFRWRLYRGMH